MKRMIQNHPGDTVAVMLESASPGERAAAENVAVTACETVPFGHKIALRAMEKGEPVLRFGVQIGLAAEKIPAGALVDTENLRSDLDATRPYQYTALPPQRGESGPLQEQLFRGYPRADQSAGIRNEIWILPTVGCVNGVARQLEKLAQPFVGGGLEGIYAFPHQFGCSQRGEDLELLISTLAGLAQNPNAGGVLLVGLGCENSKAEKILQRIPPQQREKVLTLQCRDCGDELAAGTALLQAMAERLQKQERVPVPVSLLRIGLNCGASDAYSGLLANPVLGRVSDRLVQNGAGVILTEMSELMGSEYQLLRRCRSEQVFAQAAELFTKQRAYFAQHGESCYPPLTEQARLQGTTTPEEKSMCFAQKGGTAPISGVLQAGGQAGQGLWLLNAPGNDLVSTTLLAASGAQLILFSTGRGTPFGGPVPTFKIASNHALAQEK